MMVRRRRCNSASELKQHLGYAGRGTNTDMNRVVVGLAAAVMGVWLCSGAIANPWTIKPFERPERANITVPDLAFLPTPEDVRKYDTYYYFYKTGVSYEAA